MEKINNLGQYASIDAAWDIHPEGGRDGDYITIGANNYLWDDLSRQWVLAGSGGDTNPASQTVDGDLTVGGNLDVAGDAHVGGDMTIEGELNVSRINLLDPLPEPKDGQSIFKSIVFKRSTYRPLNISSNSGTFYNPVPSGWSDGIPSGTAPIWMSCRVFTNDGEPPQGNWSRPELMADTPGTFDVEFSDSLSRPVAPNGTNQHNGGGTQIWFDPELDASQFASRTMIWMATRTRISTSTGPTWGAWSVVKIKGETGDDGMGSESAYLVHPKAYAPIITSRYGDVPVTIGYDWQRDTAGLTIPEGSALWMSVRNYQNNVYGPWSDAVRISGDGAPGEDGADIEFIFKQMDRLPSSSDTVPSNNVSQDGYVPEEEGWYNNAKGVDADHKCEWMCQRIKHRGSSVWSDWIGPIAWSVYGDRGLDGNSVQFVFRRTSAEEGTPARPSTNDGGYVNEQGEYIPRGWSDEPQGTNAYYTKEWVSIRRKGEQQTEWGSFSEPALWAVYSENHTVEINGGYWWIDGRNTGVKAEGENGAGIALKGVVDYKTAAEATAAGGGATSLQDVTGAEIGDCYVVKDNGYLYAYNGGSVWPGNWTELGQFKGSPGDPGVSSYFHIAWAYNIDFDGNGVALDSNTIYTDYASIPIATYGYPEWQGIAVTTSDPEADNYNPTGQDPALASAYKWNHVRGKDGSDFERVYIRTKKNERPRVESGTVQTDGYLPLCTNAALCDAEYVTEGGEVVFRFSDDPKGPDKDWPYEFMAERKKVNGEWGTFGDAQRYASLWATFSIPPKIEIKNGEWWIDGINQHVKAQGDDGQGIEIKGSFSSLAELEANVANPSVGDCYYITAGADMGHLFFWDGSDWQDLGEIKGEAGQSQYMFVAWAQDVRFTNNNASEVIGFTQNNALGANYDWIGFLAYDSPTLGTITDAIKLTFKWNYVKGIDGDLYEHVYIRTTDFVSPGVKNEYSSGYTDSRGASPTADEFLPLDDAGANEYTDDPQGVDNVNQYEWECYRRMNAGVWGAWYGPYLVHNWAEAQTYIATDEGIDNVFINCDSTGKPKAQQTIVITARLYHGSETCTLVANNQDDQSSSSVVVSCDGFGGGVGTSSYSVSINSSRAKITLNVKTSAVIGSGTITINLISVDGYNVTKVIGITQVKDGSSGTKGDPGSVLRFRGLFDASDTTATYVWNANFRDCVKYGNTYYMVNNYGEILDYQNVPGSSSAWASMGTGLKFFASELLIAENAAIEMMSTNKIIFKDANGDKTAGINEDTHGSYVIYYPSGRKRYEMSYTGWNIFYNDDAENSEAWRIGNSGEIIKPARAYWSSIRLCSLGTNPPEDNTFNGSDIFTLVTYPRYFANGVGQAAYDEMIFAASETQSGSPASKQRIADGYYTDMEQPEMDQSSMSSDTWMLKVYLIESGIITDTFTITTNQE